MELVARILLSVAEAAAHLHSLGISHGDLYAHNTLFNSDGHALLGDFGAATCYTLMQTRKDLIERLEVRAFGKSSLNIVTRLTNLKVTLSTICVDTPNPIRKIGFCPYWNN